MSTAFKLAMSSTDPASARTWNGAASHASSGEALTDLFFKSARGLDRERYSELLAAAWRCDALLTLRMIAYIRHIKGGKGERQLGRWALSWLARRSPGDLVHNLHHYVATFGRWDDLVDLIIHPAIADRVLATVAAQLRKDDEALKKEDDDDDDDNNISLCAKWVPSEGKRNNEFNRRLARHMRLTHKELRQLLTRLRKRIDLLETHLSDKTLDQVDYSKVPSVAMHRHSKPDKAFLRLDEERFKAWRESLKTGETKVNAGALFPHQVVESYIKGGGADPVTEAQWASVRERLTPTQREHLKGCLVLSDVSTSMMSGNPQPILVSIALGLLISEMNPSEAFRNQVLTFSTNPEFHLVTGSTLLERVRSLSSASWGGSTDFQKCFRLILDKARQFSLRPEEMPTTLIVISDMQFNIADRRILAEGGDGERTNFQAMSEEFRAAGYTMPKLVFWNVNGSTSDFPTPASQANVALISGFSVEILNDVFSGEDITPFRVMMRTLSRPEYAVIERGPPL